ncbi:hypothetical protein DCAR_0312731 [Daucus carota subsp. sativus]|uniref:tRNA pseudouridine(55) synthase n=1 Tax=Daucus carota subsp. sativus TaxID=79200 RepID=A0A161Y076_DAUCS|nr:PREDICTED: uncharacterized protein LOC108215435 [Daucus carota subsp. sativus]WOG93447.1 hypothetical protein DCAR_0312731 [Daucus carota subsp. sativus]
MAKPLHLSRRFSFTALLRPNSVINSAATPPHFPTTSLYRPTFKSLKLISISRQYSTTATPYPLQYDMIISRPVNTPPRKPRSKLPTHLTKTRPSNSESDSELGFNDWVDKKLASNQEPGSGQNDVMDKSKRKYYNKKMKRLYGSDSEDEKSGQKGDDFVELKPEVVDFHRLHKREEELYFYDAFAYPWEKEKHYKMVYQLEKKYFPDQCFDKAFLDPGDTNNSKVRSKKGKEGVKKEDKEKEKGLVFFDEESSNVVENVNDKEVEKNVDVTEKKVEEFFNTLKKVPRKDNEVASVEPFISSRSSGLPPKWDSPTGTVVLVNKPKGWTSFTVCGKLRRLVKVKKVGHAGTLDPMATGLLIVCVGKATKVVDSYQGMIKGYSGVFRLGEATSTLDADSPVIQREPWEHVKDEDLKKTAASFCGEIWQVPPMFSAIKVGGEKMYEKARRGERIELAARRISILQFDVERSLEDRQNVIFKVTCSKGTYVRSLCADFAKTLGSCAHLTALRRDSIGQYTANDAWEFKELEEAITKEYL